MPITREEKKYLQTNSIGKANSFRHGQVSGSNSKIICAAKKLIFEDHQSDDLDVSKTGRLVNIQAAVKYIVEEVMELTPAQYDAIYSTNLNQKATLDHAIRKIVNNAPAKVASDALFDSKAILFKMCWPEYYAEHYTKPTHMQVFNASGEIKGNLIRAGRIKENAIDGTETKILNNGKFSTAKERKRNYNHGTEVDKIVYWAMSGVLSTFEMTTKELFYSLAKPRSAGWSKFGFVKIIEARECYPTPLDFYMWNSPVEYQLEHFEEYMKTRERAKLPSIKALEILYEAYKQYEEELEISK